MTHYNNGSIGNLSIKLNSNQISSFEKSVMTNAKESIEKHLSLMKIEQNQLNYALFLSIENFKLDQYADQCILLLLRYKANPNCELNQETPLTLACKKGQQLLVKTLLQYGAKPDLCNKKGQSPLAVILKDRRQNYDIAQTLFNYNASMNTEISGKHPLVIVVQKQFLRIFQIMIEKGTNLVYQNENILHVIMKKKFTRLEKKKKFIKQVAGRLYLMQQDSNHKLPIDYQQNEDLKFFLQEHFKPKILKQDSYKAQSGNKAVKQKQLKQLKAKEDGITKESKKKVSIKQFDNSFSEIDEQEQQDYKQSLISQENKLQQVIEIPQQQEKNQSKMSITSADNSIGSPIISNKKNMQLSCSKQFQTQTYSSGIKQNKKEKIVEQSSIQIQQQLIDKQRQQQKQRIRKKLNNSSLLHQSKKKSASTQSQLTNGAKKNKKSKVTEQIIPKTLLKRKNSSFQDQNLKNEKNKAITVKKGNKKQSIELQQRQKNNLEQEKAIQIKRMAIFKQFQELGLHIQEQIIQKIDKQQKQSETDSQQSFRGSIQTLNQQIYQLVSKITAKNQQKNTIISSILNVLQSSLRKQLQKQRKNVRIQLYIYGSQSTGLAIDNSDVDVLVNTDFQSSYLMKLLEQRGALDVQGIISAKFITSASMPVIKLQMNQKFGGMNVDLTFQTRNHMGLKCSQTIKAFMQAQPLLRPLVLVIKVLVNLYGLSDPYKGGLGSYAITLMVIALLQFTQTQKKKIENVGQLLLNFLYFYGQQIDYISQAIIIHALGLFGQQPVYCIYRLPYFTDLNPKLIIYDPLNPVNNVGRTTYRIAALKKLFSVCYLRLKQDSRCQLKDILDGSFGELITQF